MSTIHVPPMMNVIMVDSGILTWIKSSQYIYNI